MTRRHPPLRGLCTRAKYNELMIIKGFGGHLDDRQPTTTEKTNLGRHSCQYFEIINFHLVQSKSSALVLCLVLLLCYSPFVRSVQKYILIYLCQHPLLLLLLSPPTHTWSTNCALYSGCNKTRTTNLNVDHFLHISISATRPHGSGLVSWGRCQVAIVS